MAQVKVQQMQTRKKIIPLVMALGNKIIESVGFTKKINESVQWDKLRCGMSPGERLKGLILSTFTDLRIPLTHLQARLEQIDLTYLLGEKAVYQDINAFNIGRMLERVGKADCDGIYESLALTAVQENNIPIRRLHSDTTTISFHGEYDIDIDAMELTEEEKSELIEIERGYNKDGRPFDNQLVVGQVTNELGIPLVSRAMDGSTTDVEWNKTAVEYLKTLQSAGFSEGIYVADSKLITTGLVERMMSGENRVNFVSRCPASFSHKLESRMIKKAYTEGNWTAFGQYGQGKNASKYQGVSYTETVLGHPMRLLVLQSTALSGKTEQAIERAKEKLTPLIRQIEKKRYECYRDAIAEKERFLKDKHASLFELCINIVQETKETWPPGRRSKDTKPKLTETYRIMVEQVKRNEKSCREFEENESCIVLISNVMEGVTDAELLGIYKGQQVVENSFRSLKAPQLASVIYLKNPFRIKALTMLLSFALLVRAIIQYKLREGLREHNEETPDVKIFAGWNGRELKTPTFKLLYEHSVYCNFERESDGNYTFMWPNIETQNCVEPLLKLMHLDIVHMLE